MLPVAHKFFKFSYPYETKSFETVKYATHSMKVFRTHTKSIQPSFESVKYATHSMKVFRTHTKLIQPSFESVKYATHSM